MIEVNAICWAVNNEVDADGNTSEQWASVFERHVHAL